ncbi:hypothetical protein HYU15_02880 [Candidatus Woesearchaeota archaeon]|nr:hypothetical protein [Candidatus Woesearchaeota archaeon]
MMKGFSPEDGAAIAAVSVVLLIGLLLFGFTGFKALSVFLLFFVLPAYAIMSSSDLDYGERLFFALFISLGVFPIAVWLANKILPSFRLSTVAVFALAVALGVLLHLVRRAR